MRPPSILLFEKAFFASLAVGVANTLLSWSTVSAAVNDPRLRAAGVGEGALATGVIIGLLLPVVLWYFIARRASNVAKWIFVVLTAFSLLGFVQAVANPMTPKQLTMILNVITLVLQIYAAWLLFKPDAKAWLDSRGSDPGAPGPIT